MSNRNIWMGVNSKYKVLDLQLQKFLGHCFEVRRNLRQQCVILRSESFFASELVVLAVKGQLRTVKQTLLATVTFLPELNKVGLHPLKQSRLVCGGIGVDHVVDSLFGDNKSVAKRLAFWRNAVGCVFLIKPLWVLPSVIGCEIANNVRVH